MHTLQKGLQNNKKETVLCEVTLQIWRKNLKKTMGCTAKQYVPNVGLKSSTVYSHHLKQKVPLSNYVNTEV